MDDGNQHKRRMVHLGTPDIPGLYVPFSHFDCVHNQRVSICNRVCGQVGQPTKEGLTVMRAGAKIIGRHLPRTEQEELGAFAAHYGGAKKKRYDEALFNLLNEGITQRDAGVTMFIKCEKTSPLKVNPDPRAIQFRDAKYCVALASYLKPIEPHLYRLRCQTEFLSGATRLVGKGMNQIERARVLRQKMGAFGNPVVLSLDMARFDQHVALEALEIEHSVYLKSNSSSYLRWLLTLQLYNHVRSRVGYKYTTRGKRMSGDMNTALGNCVLMLSMLIGIFETQFKFKYDLFDDGDDCLLIIEEENFSTVMEKLPPIVSTMGHELKIENVAREMSDVVWCQSKPIFDGKRWKFVRDPIKVMSNCLVGTRWLNKPEKTCREFLAGLGQCEAALNSGVPVLQEYARALLRNSQGAKARFDKDSGEWWRYVRELRSRGSDVITAESRISFYKAFNITIDQQLTYEQTLSNWTIPCGPVYESHVSWNAETWVNDRTEFPEFQ